MPSLSSNSMDLYQRNPLAPRVLKFSTLELVSKTIH